jgi:hypothetical protein
VQVWENQIGTEGRAPGTAAYPGRYGASWDEVDVADAEHPDVGAKACGKGVARLQLGFGPAYLNLSCDLFREHDCCDEQGRNGA